MDTSSRNRQSTYLILRLTQKTPDSGYRLPLGKGGGSQARSFQLVVNHGSGKPLSSRGPHRRRSEEDVHISPPSSYLTEMMRKLAAQFDTYLCRSKPHHVQSRNLSSSTSNGRDELSIEEDAERKIGWLLKFFFAGTATFIGYQVFPYMGDNLVQQSVALLRVEDPFFKRMGASRLARFAIDDERRMKIVDMGGAQRLINMLGAAKDDRTRKAALKALAALSQSDEAVGALHHVGAISVIKSTPDSLEEAEIDAYKSTLLKRFQDLRYEASS